MKKVILCVLVVVAISLNNIFGKCDNCDHCKKEPKEKVEEQNVVAKTLDDSISYVAEKTVYVGNNVKEGSKYVSAKAIVYAARFFKYIKDKLFDLTDWADDVVGEKKPDNNDTKTEK